MPTSGAALSQMDSGQSVQHGSSATVPESSDLIRPVKIPDLHQRPSTTCMPLVHTEEVTGSNPVAPTDLDKYQLSELLV